MASFFIIVVSILLVILCLVTVLLVLMQKSANQAGMGAALGGGAAEQAFGAETNSVLSRSTQMATLLFFLLTFGLYLAFQALKDEGETGPSDTSVLDQVAVPGETESAPVGTEAVESNPSLTPAPPTVGEEEEAGTTNPDS
ncbi:MAG: preprotein translocase subunit SecG [Opitutales bacterium]